MIVCHLAHSLVLLSPSRTLKLHPCIIIFSGKGICIRPYWWAFGTFFNAGNLCDVRTEHVKISKVNRTPARFSSRCFLSFNPQREVSSIETTALIIRQQKPKKQDVCAWLQIVFALLEINGSISKCNLYPNKYLNFIKVKREPTNPKNNWQTNYLMLS